MVSLESCPGSSQPRCRWDLTEQAEGGLLIAPCDGTATLTKLGLGLGYPKHCLITDGRRWRSNIIIMSSVDAAMGDNLYPFSVSAVKSTVATILTSLLSRNFSSSWLVLGAGKAMWPHDSLLNFHESTPS